MAQLEFEKPILEIEAKIKELQNVSGDAGFSIKDELVRMQDKAERLLNQAYSKLTPAQKVQVARHENRPRFKHYIDGLITNFIPLCGDRNFADDQALIGGLGRFRGQACMVIGLEKGSDTEERIKHNFGMARPEGYRKAQRLIHMAEHFDLPIITLVDTAGAYPGVGAEERGQSEAIARSIEACLKSKSPLVSIIIGEGGSGGAIALAAGDMVYMLEHSIYSVISPEGCASILWRSAEHAKEAAQALKLTASDMLSLKLIDGIIEEPVGGAHRNKAETIKRVGDTIEKSFKKLQKLSADDLIKKRQEKYLDMGQNLL